MLQFQENPLFKLVGPNALRTDESHSRLSPSELGSASPDSIYYAKTVTWLALSNLPSFH